jgi:hypothetical protein
MLFVFFSFWNGVDAFFASLSSETCLKRNGSRGWDQGFGYEIRW